MTAFLRWLLAALALIGTLYAVLFGIIGGRLQVAYRARVAHAETIACALERYHSEHGCYPVDLRDIFYKDEEIYDTMVEPFTSGICYRLVDGDGCVLSEPAPARADLFTKRRIVIRLPAEK